ncbi:Heterokaryon incompatibility protein (HET) domain containing protein [Hyaloscypha variabilis]
MDTLRDALYQWVNAWRADNSIKLTASWLEYCLKNHGPTCPGLLAPEAPLPTRLLDVLPREGSEGHYVPLHAIKLKNAKLDVYLQNIPLETLPKTFQDAISITRELGLRYIWIDSLCIIQDSPEDWEKEASLMHTVYKNAYCTVAASASRDGSGGCFVQGPYAPIQAGFEGLFQGSMYRMM